MKKVPRWTRKVLFVSQKIWCGDARNKLLNDMISGNFDIEEFYKYCRNTHNIKIDGMPTTAPNIWRAIDLCDENFEPISMQRLLMEAGI